MLRSKPAAAMLIAAAIPLPPLIGAAEAAGSTHAHGALAAQRAEAARRARALHRLETAQHAKSARTHRHVKSTAGHGRKAHAKSTAGHGRKAHAKSTAGHGRKAHAHTPTVKSKSWRLVFPHASKAHAAANDPADTITDFKFTPGTLTIHVGDTVTWTNNGPTDHTATANDGSFNTGTLKKGQSASHTFTKAGTFAYICAIHPFMKGTVVVEASTASTTTPSNSSSGSGGSGSGGSGGSGGNSGSNGSGGSGTSGSSTTPSGSTSSANTGDAPSTGSSTLPQTGLDLVASSLVGLALIGGGLGLRAGVRRVSDAEGAEPRR